MSAKKMTVNMQINYVEMPKEHIPVYLHAQNLLLKVILECLRESREKIEKNYLGVDHGETN